MLSKLARSLLLSIFLLISLRPFFSSAIESEQEKKVIRIYIDPGHGGKDPGAFVDGIKESNIALSTSILLKEKLEKLPHFTVKMSRKEDKTLSLRDRVSEALLWQADLVLSIHANASTHKKLRGAEFFIDVPFKPNLEDYEAILSTEYDERSTLRWEFLEEEFLTEKTRLSKNKKTSLLTLKKLDQVEKSFKLAQELSSLWDRHKLPSGRDKGLIFTSPLFMLKHSPIPTVLVELGYLSHPVEQKMLTSKKEQKKFVDKISKGLMSFLDKHSLK